MKPEFWESVEAERRGWSRRATPFQAFVAFLTLALLALAFFGIAALIYVSFWGAE
jgi:hypothetical protein